ncbi:PspC domain-containing protein [Spongiimicrobium salis]|uniref:PspC domain-containing protein n=1 Tax=Spongiimicrobium salis TaxID=1667022 RepID=UPI00374C8D61
MNKTVNINLANIFFHIDEEAFNKLRRYLESVKRSFANTSGSDEIIADIEARIAELFHEKMENDRQVITQKEVDEVITIMGQPEDYMVDEDIFEDAPKAKTSSKSSSQRKAKKLYRDIDTKYIGGVCSGLEHYLGFDALWIRLIFVFLALFTGFGFIAYILLWILVPEAASTAQKLDMSGEAINISNIERKVKEGIDDVTEKVKNVDYEGIGNKVKKSGSSFFDTLGDIIMFLFKVFGKFIGIILIIVGAASLIGMFIGMFTVGIFDAVHLPGVDFYDMINSTDSPVWLIALLAFFAFGIPFFFTLYLGLKILVTNLKSIGNIAKFSLLGLWLLSIIGFIILAVKQASAHAYTGSVSEKQELLFDTNLDTLRIQMTDTDAYDYQENVRINGMTFTANDDDELLLISRDVRFTIQSSKDSTAQLKIRKDADGSSYKDARSRASKIDYEYTIAGNTLTLNQFLTTATENKARDQEVRMTLYVPEGTVVLLDDTSGRYLGIGTRRDRDVYTRNMPDYSWKMGANNTLICLDCPAEDIEEEEPNRVIIDEDGVDINLQDNGESLKVKIDEDGLQIDAKEGN